MLGPAMQLNLHPAVDFESGEVFNTSSVPRLDRAIDDDLRTLMSVFGGKHRDLLDALAFLTAMFAFTNITQSDLDAYSDVSNIDDGSVWDVGVFQILDLMVGIELVGFVGILFSGLHPHAATAPRGPRGRPPANNNYRMATIVYPPAKMMEAMHTIPLAPLPSATPQKSILELTPAMVKIAYAWIVQTIRVCC